MFLSITLSIAQVSAKELRGVKYNLRVSVVREQVSRKELRVSRVCLGHVGI